MKSLKRTIKEGLNNSHYNIVEETFQGEAQRIRFRNLKVGETVSLFDKNGNSKIIEVVEIDKNKLYYYDLSDKNELKCISEYIMNKHWIVNR